MKTDEEELIRKRAYELWERAGRPEGEGLQHWLQAAEEIQSTNMDRTKVAGNEPSNPGTGPTAGVKAKKVAKSAVKRKTNGANPQKKSAVSSKNGADPANKKGKRTEKVLE